MEVPMTKRVFFVIIGCLALLITLALSISSGLAGTVTSEREPNAPEEVSGHSSFIPVQGRLTNASGNPLDGTYTISFRIYSVYSGGTALCEDLNNSVVVDNGLFYTYMSMSGCSAFDGRQLYLGIQVEDDAEMTPRQYIDNVPYAYGLRPGAVISDTIGNDAILHIENWAGDGRGLRAYAMSQTGENYGVVGASRSPDGYGGFFYNNGGGVGLWANNTTDTALLATSVDGYAINASSDNDAAIFASSIDSSGVWAISTNGDAVHGASGAAAGVFGYSINGPGVYGESLSDVAIEANGTIASTAPTYLWISGSDVVAWNPNDSTFIFMDSNGGAYIERGATAGVKYVALPVTIPGVLYGQNARITQITIYFSAETEFDGITDIRVRRGEGVCPTCYVEMLHDAADHGCEFGLPGNEEGCVLTFNLTTNNVLTSSSGVVHIGLGFNFGGVDTYVQLGGIRLTVEYHD
jgi:hypothetical protein